MCSSPPPLHSRQKKKQVFRLKFTLFCGRALPSLHIINTKKLSGCLYNGQEVLVTYLSLHNCENGNMLSTLSSSSNLAICSSCNIASEKHVVHRKVLHPIGTFRLRHTITIHDEVFLTNKSRSQNPRSLSFAYNIIG